MLRLKKLWLRPKKNEIEKMPHLIATYHVAMAIGKFNRRLVCTPMATYAAAPEEVLGELQRLATDVPLLYGVSQAVYDFTAKKGTRRTGFPPGHARLG